MSTPDATDASPRFLVTIAGEAAEEVTRSARELGITPGEVVRVALGCRRWLRENMAKGLVYQVTKSRFGGELVTLQEVTIAPR
jgi:hypothetical protein